jgi:hypothetical protein
MKIEEGSVYKCTITLTKQEAEILKSLVQNPYMYLDSVDDEPRVQKEFREKLFNSINLGSTGIRGVHND